MVIAPNSTIILYSGMPLDDTYSDTLYFATKSNRDGFFSNVNNPYRKMVLEQNTYQRVNSGVFEAKVLADNVYDVNYMAFQNTNFGNKWFYAFVDSVEYINNLNTRITYSIDVIQTYLFDCDFEDCIVEREHSQYDTLFENILPEPVSLGEYVFDNYSPINPSFTVTEDGQQLTFDLRDNDIVVQYVDTNGLSSSGMLMGGTYVGCHYRAYRATSAGASNLASWLGNSSNIQKPEQILNIYMTPHYITRGTDDGRLITNAESWNTDRIIDVDLPTPTFMGIGGYLVKNKKLFTYPYMYLHIDDGNCNDMALRYEFFERTNSTIVVKGRIYGSPLTPVQQSFYPLGYKRNVAQNDKEMFTEKLTLAEYPLCSWNYDTYKAWVAQNALPLILKGITSVGGAVGMVAGAGAIGGFGAMSSVAGDVGLGSKAIGLTGIITEWYKASIKADTMRGAIANGNALFFYNKLGFNSALAHQPVEYLRVIDDFFNMYGYTTNRLKKPNISSRPHWNYVKTRGAKLIGACPTNALKQMCSIFDSGITFWKNASEVGNYSLDNRPVELPNP